MNMSIDTASLASHVGLSYGGAQGSVAKASSGGSTHSAAPVKLSIDIALLKRSREMNADLAGQLLESLPPLGK